MSSGPGTDALASVAISRMSRALIYLDFSSGGLAGFSLKRRWAKSIA